MAANGILVRPLPSLPRGLNSLPRGRSLVLLAGAVIAVDLIASLLITHEQGQTVRVFGLAVVVAVGFWFAMGTRSALVAFAAVQVACTMVTPGAAHGLFASLWFVDSADQVLGNHVARVTGALGGPGETSVFLLVTASFGLLRYALLRDDARSRGIAAGVAL